MEDDSPEVYCDFCGDGPDQVKVLFEGQKALICDECVLTLHEVLVDSLGDEELPN